MPRLPSLTVADLMSLSRLLLAAAFVVVRGPVARLALIGAAGITDFLDGWLARRRGETSAFGAVLDPATDHAFVLIVVAVLVVDGTLTLLQTLVLLSRDIVTTVGVVVVRAMGAHRSMRLEARFSGKVVTALQFAALIGAIAVPRSVPWLLTLVAIASTVSVADYAGAFWRGRRRALALVVLACLPASIEAQGFPRGQTTDAPSRVRMEVRTDAFLARLGAVHAGVGAAADLGTYFRVAGLIGAGAAYRSHDTMASGRAEVVGRFVMDPFRQARWGLYGGAGLIARYEDGPGTRGFLTLLVGAELPSRRPTVTALELGVGGGVRLGVAVRRGRLGRR